VICRDSGCYRAIQELDGVVGRYIIPDSLMSSGSRKSRTGFSKAEHRPLEPFIVRARRDGPERMQNIFAVSFA